VFENNYIGRRALINDSKIFEGLHLDGLLRTDHSLSDLDNGWGQLAESAGTVGTPRFFCRGGLHDPIVRFLEQFVRLDSKVLDVCGGAYSYVHSDVVDVSNDAMELNPHSKNKFPCDLRLEPRFDSKTGGDNYDLVTILLGMAYIERPLDVFTAAYATLKPGGRFVVGFDNSYSLKFVTPLWEAITPFVYARLNKEILPEKLQHLRIALRWRKAFVAHYMNKVGFEDIHSETILPELYDGLSEFTMIVGNKPEERSTMKRLIYGMLRNL
jgi:SAM-dependent methyltransferase